MQNNQDQGKDKVYACEPCGSTSEGEPGTCCGQERKLKEDSKDESDKN